MGQYVRARRGGNGVCGIRSPCLIVVARAAARHARPVQNNVTPRRTSHRIARTPLFPRKMSASKGDSIPNSPAANSFHKCAQAHAKAACLSVYDALAHACAVFPLQAEHVAVVQEGA